MALVTLSVAGCSAGSESTSSAIGEAITGSSCTLGVSTCVHDTDQTGFAAFVTVKNNGSTPEAGFSVLVKAGGAKLLHASEQATFQQNEFGYVVTPRKGTKLAPGESIKLNLVFSGAYSTISAYVMSAGGVSCEGTPTVSLTSSGTLFTSNAALTLSANASDSVGVGKVVFADNGTPISTLYSAPYTVTVPVTSALNGRHVYTATAYNYAENQASQSTRVLVAIGNKFFGTEVATAADYTDVPKYFNQITPGNAGKWGSVEAVQGTFDWTDLDTAYNYAQTNHLRFKFHNLIWGQQQPSWITSLSTADQLTAINQWFAAVAARYPQIDMIDVVNEPLHTPPPYAAALGGNGSTGWDWVITAYQLARQYFPHSELLINDYSTLALSSTTQQYVSLVNLLAARGLIDGIGEQGHFYERSPDVATLQANLSTLAGTGLPIYVSELDLNLANDAQQANRMSQIFPIFWSNPSVVGVTNWGYLQGNTWQPDAYLVNSDGSLRPAFTWLECYMGGGTNCPVPTYVPQPRVGTSTGLTVQAPDFDAANGLLASGNVVAYANDGSWLAYDKVSFDSNWNNLNVTYALGSSSPITLTFSLGSLSNTPVATATLAPTGGWGTNATVSVPWPSMSSSVQDLYVTFHGGGANLQTFQFTGPAPNLVANGTFESGTSGWYTWGGGSLGASTARAHSGSQSLLVTNRGGNAPAATDLTSVVTPGSNYPFSLWVSINSSDGSSQSLHVTEAASCKAADGSVSTTYTWIGGPTTVPSGATWTQLSGSVAVPNCTLTQLQFYVEGGAGADLYVDDVQVNAPAGPVNLITDGTFESGQGSWFGWGESSLAVTSASAHSGTYSLLASGLSSGAIARDISSLVTPGHKYQATAWVSVGNLASGSGSVNWQTVQNCDSATSDSYPWLAGATVNNGAWAQVTGVVDLTSCTTINKLLLFAGAASGDLYIDDVSLIAQ